MTRARPLAELSAMLDRFDRAVSAGDGDDYVEGVQVALSWALGHTRDEDVEAYLPEDV